MKLELVQQDDGKWTVVVDGNSNRNLSLHSAGLFARSRLTEWSKREAEKLKTKEAE